MNRSSLMSSLATVFEHRYVKDVAFRLIARCDAFPLFDATRHEDFNRYLLWPAPAAEHHLYTQVDKLIRETRLNNAVILSVCERVTGTWLGLIRLQPYHDGVEPDGIEMGMYLHPKVWSRGAVNTAGRAIVETLVTHVDDLPIYVRVRLGNQRMEKICAFYHFERGRRVTDTHVTEGPVELDLFRLRKDLWVPFPEVATY